MVKLTFTDAEAEAHTLATWCKELTHWKRPWCWERLKAGGKGDDRGWDGWLASPTRWTWVWVNSGSWWWTGKPGELQSMESQRVGHDWATELNWTDANILVWKPCTSHHPFPINKSIFPLTKIFGFFSPSILFCWCILLPITCQMTSTLHCLFCRKILSCL